MTPVEMQKVLELVTYRPYWVLRLEVDEAFAGDGQPFLQWQFAAHNRSIQRSRKWRLSPHMTRSELVQTAFKALLTALEHEAREEFRYRGEAIFGPHFNVELLVGLCRSARPLEERPLPGLASAGG